MKIVFDTEKNTVKVGNKTFGIDIWEVMFGRFWIFMSNIQANVIETVNLHLLINGTSYDIAWSQTQSLIIFFHESFAIR